MLKTHYPVTDFASPPRSTISEHLPPSCYPIARLSARVLPIFAKVLKWDASGTFPTVYRVLNSDLSIYEGAASGASKLGEGTLSNMRGLKVEGTWKNNPEDGPQTADGRAWKICCPERKIIEEGTWNSCWFDGKFRSWNGAWAKVGVDRKTMFLNDDGSTRLIAQILNFPEEGKGEITCLETGIRYSANWSNWRFYKDSTPVDVIFPSGTLFTGILKGRCRYPETFNPVSGTFKFTDGSSYTGNFRESRIGPLPTYLPKGSIFTPEIFSAILTECSFNQREGFFELKLNFKNTSKFEGRLDYNTLSGVFTNPDGSKFTGSFELERRQRFFPSNGEGTFFPPFNCELIKISGKYKGQRFVGTEERFNGDVVEYLGRGTQNEYSLEKIKIKYFNGEEFSGFIKEDESRRIPVIGEGTWNDVETGIKFRGIWDRENSKNIEVIYPDGTIYTGPVDGINILPYKRIEESTHSTYNFNTDEGEFTDWRTFLVTRSYPHYSVITNDSDFKCILTNSSFTLFSPSGELKRSPVPAPSFKNHKFRAQVFEGVFESAVSSRAFGFISSSGRRVKGQDGIVRIEDEGLFFSRWDGLESGTEIDVGNWSLWVSKDGQIRFAKDKRDQSRDEMLGVINRKRKCVVI